MHNQLQHKQRIVSAAPNVQDFLDLLEEMASNVADIRTKIGGPEQADSIEIRQALAQYLQGSVDTLRRIRKNELSRSAPEQNDDV